MTVDAAPKGFLELSHIFLDGVTLAAVGEGDREEWLPVLTNIAVMWCDLAELPRGEGAETLAHETFKAFASQDVAEPEPGARGRFLRSIDSVLSDVCDEVHATHGTTA